MWPLLFHALILNPSTLRKTFPLGPDCEPALDRGRVLLLLTGLRSGCSDNFPVS